MYKIKNNLWKRLAVGTCLTAYMGLSVPALAAGVTIPETVLPGRNPSALPVVPESNFDFSIDQPRGAKDQRALSTLQFQVTQIVVDDAVTLPKSEIEALTKPLIGKSASLGDLSKVAEAIENAYHDKGYLLTRALVPAQKTKDGVFHIKVIEGRVAAAVVTGARPGTKEAIETLAIPLIGQNPTENATIERTLLLVNDLPGVVAAGTLEPGAADKTSNLTVAVTQPLWAASASTDNRGSKYSGPYQENLSLSLNSLAGLGEQTVVYGTFTMPTITGSDSVGSKTTVPFGDGWSAASQIDYAKGAPGYSLAGLAIRTTSLSLGPTVNYAVVRSRAWNLSLSNSLTWHDSKTDAIGKSISRDRWSTMGLTATWSENGLLWGGTTSGTFGVSQGLPVFSSEDGNGSLARVGSQPTATKLTFTTQRTQPLTGPVSLFVATTGQYAFRKLMSGEEFGVGGTQFGRGLDSSVVSGDHGAAVTVEVRYDLDSFGPLTPYIQAVQLFVFNDGGVVTTIDKTSGYPSKIDTIGLGARVAGVSGWSGNFDVDDVRVGPADSRGGHGVRFFAGVSRAF